MMIGHQSTPCVSDTMDANQIKVLRLQGYLLSGDNVAPAPYRYRAKKYLSFSIQSCVATVKVYVTALTGKHCWLHELAVTNLCEINTCSAMDAIW